MREWELYQFYISLPQKEAIYFVTYSELVSKNTKVLGILCVNCKGSTVFWGIEASSWSATEVKYSMNVSAISLGSVSTRFFTLIFSFWDFFLGVINSFSVFHVDLGSFWKQLDLLLYELDLASLITHDFKIYYESSWFFFTKFAEINTRLNELSFQLLCKCFFFAKCRQLVDIIYCSGGLRSFAEVNFLSLFFFGLNIVLRKKNRALFLSSWKRSQTFLLWMWWNIICCSQIKPILNVRKDLHVEQSDHIIYIFHSF